MSITLQQEILRILERNSERKAKRNWVNVIIPVLKSEAVGNLEHFQFNRATERAGKYYVKNVRFVNGLLYRKPAHVLLNIAHLSR